MSFPLWLGLAADVPQITVLVAIGGYFLLVPFPDDRPDKCWNFLNEREVAFVMARVEADRADSHTEPFSLVKFLKPGLDPKIWGFALIFCCITTVTYALAYFLPIILRDVSINGSQQAFGQQHGCCPIFRFHVRVLVADLRTRAWVSALVKRSAW